MAAAGVFARICDRETLRPVNHQESGQHDFDILVDGRQVGILEVTSVHSEGRHKLAARIRDKRSGGSIVPAVQSRQSWSVQLNRAALHRMSELRESLDPLLASVEAAGVERVSNLHQYDDVRPSALKSLVNLGVEHAYPFQSSPAHGHHLIEAGEVFSTHPGIVNILVADRLGREDNWRKLTKGNLAQRELFVWVDRTADAAYLVVWDGIQHPPPPEIPPPISRAWVAVETPDATKVVVLVAERGGDWERHVLDTESEADSRGHVS